MFKDSESKKNLLKSLITSSIFLIFLKPILEFCWDLLSKFSKFTYFNVIDSWYRSAALGQRNWIDFVLFSGILFFGITSFFRLRMEIFKKVAEIDNNNELIKKHEKRDEKFYSYAITFTQQLRKYRIVLDIIFLLLTFYLLTSAYSDLQLNTSFNQRLKIIAPYIDENKEELLVSNWSKMTCKADFEKINAEMEKIAKINHIILPPNLLN